MNRSEERVMLSRCCQFQKYFDKINFELEICLTFVQIYFILLISHKFQMNRITPSLALQLYQRTLLNLLNISFSSQIPCLRYVCCEIDRNKNCYVFVKRSAHHSYGLTDVTNQVYNRYDSWEGTTPVVSLPRPKIVTCEN